MQDPGPPRRCVGIEAARARHGSAIDELLPWFHVGDPGGDCDDAPAWLDPARVDRGGEVLRRHGLLTSTVLRCYALPLSYRSPVGVVPLVHTGALLRESAARLYRTADMVFGAQQTGALHPGGPGWSMAAHVRAMHARVRQSLWDAGWDPADGAPIPQPDLAATALLFGPLTVVGLRRMGAEVSQVEADDVAHLARAMAHGQGVVPELQTDTHAAAVALFDHITSLDGPATSEGAALMEALLDVPHTLARGRRDRLVAPLLRRVYRDVAAATLEHDAPALGVHGSGALARPIQWVAKIHWLHHRRFLPVHDAMVAGVMARGRTRIRRVA